MPLPSRGLVPVACLVAGVLLGCRGTQSQPDNIAPYEIVEIVPGVYAALANIGGSGFGNAGIINMGSQAIVYDTGLTPEAGRHLREAAERLTGQNVTIVINSHFHDDHIGGNQAFDQPSYLATTSTQRAVEAAGETRTPESVAEAESTLHQIRELLRSERDDKLRRDLTLVAGRLGAIVSSSDEFTRVVPTLVWDRRLNFTGSLRRIKFMPALQSHTFGDAMLFLEADSILFASDIVATDRHPAMQDGDPDGWKTLLDSMLTLDFNVLVPGHGPLGDRQSVVRMREYLEFVDRAAAEVANGASIDAVVIDSAFSDWMLESQFRENVRFVMEKRQQ